MRQRIEALDVDAMKWQPTPAGGVYMKRLSTDEETGARTTMTRLNPTEDYTLPHTAHYHPGYEEILGVSGNFSFDSRLWMIEGSYVYHPPLTVHGFKSAVPEDSVFLGRVSGALVTTFIDDPEQDDLYLVDGSVPSRSPVAYGDPMAANSWETIVFLGGNAQMCRLSADDVTGEGTAFVRLPAGWQSALTAFDHDLELFVMQGMLEVGDGRIAPIHAYFSYPRGSEISPLLAQGETVLYVNFSGLLF
jgi:hypothetical protein